MNITCSENIAKILDFRNLKDNWNGHGTIKPPDDDLLINAIDFVRKFTNVKQPEVFLTVNSSIKFEWDEGNNHLEFELSEEEIEMYELFDDLEVTNRTLDNNEYMAINYITRCVLDKWYKED